MPTLKYMIRGSLRKDNTYNCVIRITHARKSTFVSPGIYVASNEVTKAGKIKNKLAVAKLEDIITEYRNKLLAMSDINDLDVKDIAELLLYKDNRFRLDFFEYAKSKIERMKPGTQRSYYATLIHLKAVTGDKLPIEKFTRSVVDAMCNNLLESGMLRGPSLYMQCLKNLFKMACDEYNGENMDSWKIRHNPFYNFKIPKERLVPSRALTIEQVREIIAMPYLSRGECDNPGVVNFARDVFVLSLCLLGINTADLYSCEDIKDGIITYMREKTKDKRDDSALMKVNTNPLIKHLADKYISGNSFVFKTRYATAHNFNQVVNKGLKTLQPLLNNRLKEKGIEEIKETLTYYYARHTFATIAQNELGFDKYYIAELLNHSLEGSLKTTNRYTKRDWNRIFDANNKIVDYILEGKEYKPKEADNLSGRSNTGYKGIYLYNGRFRVVAFANGTNKNVGFFATLEEAIMAKDEYTKKASE